MNKLLWNLIRIIILFSAISLLIGCSSMGGAKVACKSVNIKIPKESIYPIYNLKKGDSPDFVMKSYVATVKGQRNYIDQLKYLINKEE